MRIVGAWPDESGRDSGSRLRSASQNRDVNFLICQVLFFSFSTAHKIFLPLVGMFTSGWEQSATRYEASQPVSELDALVRAIETLHCTRFAGRKSRSRSSPLHAITLELESGHPTASMRPRLPLSELPRSGPC